MMFPIRSLSFASDHSFIFSHRSFDKRENHRRVWINGRSNKKILTRKINVQSHVNVNYIVEKERENFPLSRFISRKWLNILSEWSRRRVMIQTKWINIHCCSSCEAINKTVRKYISILMIQLVWFTQREKKSSRRSCLFLLGWLRGKMTIKNKCYFLQVLCTFDWNLILKLFVNVQKIFSTCVSASEW